MLDNVPHIKAYWVSMTPEVAQIALRFGADDVDGTIVHETIYHAAGSRSPSGLTVRELVRLIREAGRIPVERDTLYNVVREHPPRGVARGGAEGARSQGFEAPGGAVVSDARLRVAAVGYLNARPLYEGLDREPASSRVRARLRVPSEVARRVAEDEADIALMPVAAAATIGDLRLVRGCAIGTRGPVRSVVLVARAPHRRARRARARPFVAHQRRARAPGPARAAQGTRATSRRSGPARGRGPGGAGPWGARHRRSRTRDRGPIPARAGSRGSRGASSPDCRSSSPRGAAAQAR